VRDVRNQGVLMRGVNDSAAAVLDLCFALLDNAGITPYYFYLCDMIPNAEHWRVPLHTAQRIQDGIMGFLPGFATPRLVCDVPYVGKRWVHQAASYDRMRGVSRWTSEYRAQVLSVDESGPTAGTYYDPIDSLPPEGRLWWSRQRDELAAAR
jgi:lysine 2,3-aminomutase